MEQKRKIKLTTNTTTNFVLEKEETRNLYTYLSLSQYNFLRVPDYNEKALIKQLEKDFKKYYVEMQKLGERDPNNLTISKIRYFFDVHYKHLKDLSDEYSELEKKE